MFTTMVRSIQRKARLLGAMFDRLAIDPVEAARIRGGAALAAASRTCLSCRQGDACESWLSKAWLSGSRLDDPRPDEDGSPRPPAFCPNKEFLAEACVRQASWPH